MKTEAEKVSAKNLNEPAVDVVHADLERDSEQSVFRTICPVCKLGLLCVTRDKTTLALQAEDRCLLCGQLVVYTDIENLKEIAGERGVQNEKIDETKS